MRIGLGQINPTVGALEANEKKIVSMLADAEAAGCDVVAFGELALCGYPPEDLLLRPSFVADQKNALERIAAQTKDTVAIIGFVDVAETVSTAAEHIVAESSRQQIDLENRQLTRWNAAAICAQGKILGVYHKRALPNYSVFDEQRYFVAGSGPIPVFNAGGKTFAVTICEDAWTENGPIAQVGAQGVDVVININASPFNIGKPQLRADVIATRAREANVPIVYVNQVGGQDELVFDGDSMVIDANGELRFRMEQFVERLGIYEMDSAPAITNLPSDTAQVWSALVTGTRDFVQKNGFSDVVIGLSGGIDSALVAAIATQAIGAEHVHGVLLPSRYSSDHSITDAVALAENLGIEHRTIPIEPAHSSLMEMLEPSFRDRNIGLAEENLQSRIRAVVLMGLSNAYGWLLLNTGNKSESSVGYSTLYGDSAGGFAVIKDVSKLLVYQLCYFCNEVNGREIIPSSVLTKPPSAELRPDQRDDQSLPPYEELDPILALYVEGDFSAEEIIAKGHNPEVVHRIVGLVDLAEYKRRQAPPGPRVTSKAFGKDRRLPIVNRYRRQSNA